VQFASNIQKIPARATSIVIVTSTHGEVSFLHTRFKTRIVTSAQTASVPHAHSLLVAFAAGSPHIPFT
jgi:hypothetical protein